MNFNKELQKKQLSKFIKINPIEKVKKDSILKKISMADIQPHHRKIENYMISKYNGGSKFRNGDTLMARITPCLENGKTAFVDILNSNEIAFGSTEFIVLRNIKDESINKYVYYFTISPKFRNLAIKSMTGTSGRQRVQEDVLKNFAFIVPEIEEQKNIVSILSSLDDKIELNNQVNKNLEQIAQAIFKHWFIDFEFPNENGEPYKSSDGEMVDSELGPIPKGWNVRSLNQIANFLNGLAMQKYRPLNDENYLSVLKIKELKVGKTSKNSDKCSMNIDPKYIVNDGDVVFSWSGSLEVKLWCDGKAGLNQHLFKVTSANYPKWFYYYWIKHHIEDFRRIAEGKTTTMGHIKREHLSKAKVFDPGKKFFEKFDKVINGLIELYINNEKEIKYLSQIRDILLPKLISGEIRVPVNNKVLIIKNN